MCRKDATRDHDFIHSLADTSPRGDDVYEEDLTYRHMASTMLWELTGLQRVHAGTPQPRDASGILCSLAWLAACDHGIEDLAWVLREASLDATPAAAARSLFRRAGISSLEALPRYLGARIALLEPLARAEGRVASADIARLHPCRRFPRYLQYALFRETGLAGWLGCGARLPAAAGASRRGHHGPGVPGACRRFPGPRPRRTGHRL